MKNSWAGRHSTVVAATSDPTASCIQVGMSHCSCSRSGNVDSRSGPGAVPIPSHKNTGSQVSPSNCWFSFLRIHLEVPGLDPNISKHGSSCLGNTLWKRSHVVFGHRLAWAKPLNIFPITTWAANLHQWCLLIQYLCWQWVEVWVPRHSHVQKGHHKQQTLYTQVVDG